MLVCAVREGIISFTSASRVGFGEGGLGAHAVPAAVDAALLTTLSRRAEASDETHHKM